MNWLSFFMGVTAAWVFMGIFIFLFDMHKKPKLNEVERQLLEFWAESNRIGNEKIECLKTIANRIAKVG